MYDWVKGHADDLNRELNRAERLNVIADEQCDIVRQQASDPRSVRSSTGLWDSETCALFIWGRKITSYMKERLIQQLLDGDLWAYLEKNEHWSAHHFESIDWTNYSSAFKSLSKGQQTAVAKATQNLWHTGTRQQQYFGDAKPCCMCNCEAEDWRHVLTCVSIDASLHRAASWENIRKSMERWHLPPYFWTMIEKGINHYTEQTHKGTIHSKDNEPQFNTPRNLLQQAFRTHSHIGWDNFLKGRISRDCINYVRHNKAHSNGHGTSKDWSEKFIGGLWEHLKRLWQFRNDNYNQDNEGTIARYKLEGLEREMEKLWTRHTELLPKLWDFQNQHFNRRQRPFSMKARNVGQHSPNYTWMTKKPTDLEVTAISSRTSDGEQEWDNWATTQLIWAGIVAYVLLPSFGTISLVKAQLT
jgi:hypothetical protein